MAWVRLDDRFPLHPKTVQAGKDAAWLYVVALCWCNQYQTDGHLTAGALRRLEAVAEVEHAQELAIRLLEVGLWESCALHDDCFAVANYAEYQPTKAELDERRRQRAEAGRKGGRRAAEVRAGDGGGGAVPADTQANAQAPAQAPAQARATAVATAPAQANAQAPAQASTTPSATDTFQANGNPVPVPVPKERKEHTSTAVDVDDGFEPFWSRYPPRNGKRVDKAKARGQWRKLKPQDREAAMVGVRHYADACGRRVTLAKDAHRWLRDRCWEDWQTPAAVDDVRPVRSAPDLLDM